MLSRVGLLRRKLEGIPESVALFKSVEGRVAKELGFNRCDIREEYNGKVLLIYFE